MRRGTFTPIIGALRSDAELVVLDDIKNNGGTLT